MATKPMDVLCKCHLTWSQVHNQLNQLGDLIQCDICKMWFHEVCESVDRTKFEHPVSGIAPNVFQFKYIHGIFFTFLTQFVLFLFTFKLAI